MSIDKVNGMLEEKQIRTIIDLYANYADTKQTDKQIALFSDDFQLEIYYDSTSDIPTQTINDKENLKQVVSASLSPFPKTMHFNGQSIINFLSENEAEGIVYCRAYHYSKDGEAEKLMIAPIIYEDNYKKVGEQRLFTKRELKVQWIENR